MWKSSWLPRSEEKLPSNLSSNAIVGQHELTAPPTLDTRIAAAQCWLFTHSWRLEWWRSGRVDTLVGPAHNTFGAPSCSEIPSTFAWGRKVPSIRSVLYGSCDRVLSMERLCTSRGDYLASVAENDRMKQNYTRLPTTLHTYYQLHYSRTTNYTTHVLPTTLLTYYPLHYSRTTHYTTHVLPTTLLTYYPLHYSRTTHYTTHVLPTTLQH